uniref:uncharacterized protein LOC120828283 isoform X2 n=1 Tax=Gasterosteus aculeatus aculeatus TaxID=481459 RepID=UPI001A983FD1|nr:uncharacterized protein LOC120828283 isoform X2 [Gasterosteus aculeatus aculeatus]
METPKNSPSPRIPVTRDDSGLWMRMDSDPLMDHTGGRGRKPREATTDPPRGPAVITRYYSVMDDDDNNFVPPPPPDAAPSLHADAQVNNSNVTFTKGSAEDNPSGLGWHPGESRLMATQSAAEQVNTEQTSTDGASPPEVSILPEEQDLTSMEGACCDPTQRRHHGRTAGGEQSEPEDILSEGQKRCREAQSNKNPKQVPSNIGENSENTQNFDKEGESMCGFAKTYSAVQHADFGEDFESNEPPEPSKRPQNPTDAATCRPYVPEVPVEESNGHSISDGSEETGQGDGSRRISNGIQQGEQLLQRLQLVQLRQDVSLPGSPDASQQAVRETRGETRSAPGSDVGDSKARGAHLTGENEEEESGGERWKPMAVEGSGRYAVELEAGMSLLMPTVQSGQHNTTMAEAGDYEEDQRDPGETSSTQNPFLSTCHRLSASEAWVEGRSPSEALGSLQRASGIFDVADDPDVLEIPFKNHITLDPFPTEDGGDWQFSSQKMKKEISQETRRELVLVNQGKIPGGYSKGEVRQRKETKLLFEAFQQINTDGPARPPRPIVKGHVYPSVLERTRSMEMLSLKSRPVCRTQSFRLIKESEKHAEILRPSSLKSGSLDKARPSHSARHKERAQPSGSADSGGDAGSRDTEANGPKECPAVRGNPFFKLRPALALKPEVEKDIREAKEREEELRRQRCTLYGENGPRGEDGEGSRFKPTLATDVRKQLRGKLERVWPPPSKKDQKNSEQTQEAKVHRVGGQRASLWQRWESGLINGKTPKEKK